MLPTTTCLSKSKTKQPMLFSLLYLALRRLLVSHVVNRGVRVAVFNSLLALEIMYGCVLWSAARDGAFSGWVGTWVGRLSAKGQVPWVACLLVAVIGGACVFSSTIIGLVTLSAFITLTCVGLMPLAVLWLHRKKDAPLDRYRMPLGPAIPLAILVAFFVFATGRSAHDLFIVLVTTVIALGYAAALPSQGPPAGAGAPPGLGAWALAPSRRRACDGRPAGRGHGRPRA